MNERVKWIQKQWWLAGIDLSVENTQAKEEGRNLSRVQSEFDRLLAVKEANRTEQWYAAAAALTDRIQTLPVRKDYRYIEPSDLAGIQAVRPKSTTLQTWHGTRSEFLRRLHGGLLGRICGCLLGKPIECCWRDDLQIFGEETGNWPIRDYYRTPTTREAKHIASRKPHLNLRTLPGWLRDTMHGMVEDDDTNYTTTGFAIVKKYGADFTPVDVANFWCDNIPIFHTCTAERVAYRNFVDCIIPPASATHRNPYREWIGAQIRADYFGYANPGNPARAAEWAWRDASISHIKNGIYGEMWVAAMLAAAYVEKDWVKIIRAGLAQVPVNCRLREDVEKIITAHAAGLNFEEVVQLVHTQWDERVFHNWCHTNSNAQVVVIGLLWGEDDYEKTITRAIMPAFDTDCNGATAGSLWGVKHGVDALPKKWTRPMHDIIRTGVDGYHEVKISKLAEEMVDVALKAAPHRRRK